ncbi:MAG: hypothetical protein WBL19_00425 [Minisyncoccia bacterium]
MANAIFAVGGGVSSSFFSRRGVASRWFQDYWTTCQMAQVMLVRISPSGVVNGFIPTTVVLPVTDLAFDASQDHIWLFRTGSQPRVYHAITGALVGLGGAGFAARGIAWDGASRVVVDSLMGHFDTTSFAWVPSTTAVVPYSDGGLMFLPSTGRYITGGTVPGDPGGFTSCEFREQPDLGSSSPPVEATMPPDLSLSSGASGRGGNLAGCEAWYNAASGEWLGVFCQRNTVGDAVIYTCRMPAATASGCSGPKFARGPAIVQSNLFAGARQASGFAWLVVAFGPGSVTHPIFAPGCTFLLDPGSALLLGAFLPDFSGNVSGGTSVPVAAALHELPLWFQWATLSFTVGAFELSEMRVAAVKQF